MSNIKNRNLIVTETFDEFAEHTDEMDFSVEDLVAYVTSLAQVFYWLNVESVWGRLGFVWDNYDSSTKQGYGHFVHTTIPFSVIPSLPDGERVTQLNNATFAYIESSSFKLLKSNWENLIRISNISKNSELDLTGAPLTGMFSNTGSTYWDPIYLMGGSSMYLKADFSNCCADGNQAYFWINSASSGVFIVDDDNKYLNMPSHMYDSIPHTKLPNTKNSVNIYWKGEGAFKPEYIWRDIDGDSILGGPFVYNTSNEYTGFYYPFSLPSSNHDGGRIYLNSDSLKYVIPTMVKESPEEGQYTTDVLFRLSTGGNAGGANKGGIVDVTIDCTYSSIALMVHLVDDRFDSKVIIPDFDEWYHLGPIKFIGELSAIDIYNPYVTIIHGEWPEFDADVVSKVMDNNQSALIYHPTFIGELSKCPYTFNLANRNYAAFLYNAYGLNSQVLRNLIHEDAGCIWLKRENAIPKSGSSLKYNYFVYNIMPELAGKHRMKKIDIRFPIENVSNTTSFIPNENMGGDGETHASGYSVIVGKIPSVESDYVYLNSVFVSKENKVMTSHLEQSGVHLESSDSKNIYFYSSSEYDGYYLNNASVNAYQWKDIDYIEFESLDDNILNVSNISTWKDMAPGAGYSFLQPLVVTKDGIRIVQNSEISKWNGVYFNPSYIFIKSGVNLEFTFNSPNDFWSVANIKRVINGIKKIGDNTAVGSITLKQWIFEQFTETEKSYIMNDLGYTLIEQI